MSDAGTFARLGVEVLGTSVESIRNTEDRDLFFDKLTQINQPMATSVATSNVKEAIDAANKIGYPLICRAAFALGGLGSGFCHNEEELIALVSQSFTKSPQVLVEKDLRGWKEVEYEVVRDSLGNAITVCNMENFDPLGIHTGDSIVVAPSQTLTNDEYHMLRESSIDIASHLGIIGECNVQYALHPESLDYIVIEANPRLSRSSALASKATGYPLAAVAAQLGLGISLPELQNPITSGKDHSTSAFFEPSLDYCVVKIPRWDTSKFAGVSNKLGSAMKSVGEVMSIGRSFEESLQKAVRMVDEGNSGFEAGQFKGVDEIEEMKVPTPNRLFGIANKLYSGEMSIDDVHDITKIDKWFLQKLQNIVDTGAALDSVGAQLKAGKAITDGSYNVATRDDEGKKSQLQDGLGSIDTSLVDSLPVLLRTAKEQGFSDKQIAGRFGQSELDVRAVRTLMGVIPAVKQIDTLGGEYPATSNYLYTTYNGLKDDVTFEENGVLVLGSGTYRIGSSVEFDYCSVKTVKALQEMGKKTTMLNHNPETVSTDYDENDRLYFDELSLEKVLDVYEKEASEGIVVSVGGQAPNNIALKLHRAGASVLGTHPEQIDRCEDRSAYSAMLDELEIKQPEWHAATTNDGAKAFCADVGYPVIVRPSYVLSGAAMAVVRSESELDQLLLEATNVSPDYPVVVTKFIEGAYEVDVDGVANKGEMVTYSISEHLERGGVHSGDATLILPSFRLSDSSKAKMKVDAAAIAKELNISGPFNTQFLIGDNGGSEEWVGVIETNLRASRSVPFVSKVLDVDFIKRATACIIGVDRGGLDPKCDQEPAYTGVKVPQFSFQRLLGSDPVLGVEMHSTGEVACFGETVEEAYLKGLVSTYFRIPSPGENILICAREGRASDAALDAVTATANLAESNFTMVAADEESRGVLASRGIAAEVLSGEGDLYKQLRTSISLVLDLSDNHADFYETRRGAADNSISLITNQEQVKLFASALGKNDTLKTKSYDEYSPP